MRVKGLEKIEDIILAMDDLISKKNKMINFIEKKYKIKILDTSTWKYFKHIYSSSVKKSG